MPLGNPPRKAPSAQILIVEKEILVDIEGFPQRRQRSEDLRADPVENRLAGTAQHRGTTVLGPQEKQAGAQAQRFAGQAVRLARLPLVKIEGQQMAGKADGRLAVGEKIFSSGIPDRKNVVVEIEILLREPGNPVQEQLDGRAVEGWKKGRRNDVFVQHHPQMRTVCPRGYLTLPRHDQEDVLDEGHVPLDPAQEKRERPPVAVALAQGRLPVRRPVILLPERVIAVHIGDYSIHRVLPIRCIFYKDNGFWALGNGFCLIFAIL